MRVGYRYLALYLLLKKLRILPSSWAGERGQKYSWAHCSPTRLPEVGKKQMEILWCGQERDSAPVKGLLGRWPSLPSLPCSLGHV